MNFFKVIVILLLSCLSSSVLAKSTEIGIEETNASVVDPITLLAVVAVIFIIVIKAHFKHSN
ncbi:MAG: hypothetical protein HRT53_05685 [Colwellia sp.]|nr:hypothetical protein [Colwellia sp.]